AGTCQGGRAPSWCRTKARAREDGGCEAEGAASDVLRALERQARRTRHLDAVLAGCGRALRGFTRRIIFAMRHVVRIVSLAMVLIVTVAIMELTIRHLDGYRLLSLRLVQTRVTVGNTLEPGALVRRYAATLPVADGVRREWFGVVPAELPRPPLSPELAIAARQNESSGAGFDFFKLWNTLYL